MNSLRALSILNRLVSFAVIAELLVVTTRDIGNMHLLKNRKTAANTALLVFFAPTFATAQTDDSHLNRSAPLPAIMINAPPPQIRAEIPPLPYRPPQLLENPATWISDADFPVGRLRAHAANSSVLLVHVSGSGSVASCEVQQGGGDAELDAEACARISQRARFKPAQYGSDQFASGVVTMTIHWQPSLMRLTIWPPMPSLLTATTLEHPARPLAKPEDWVTASDFPLASLKRGSKGITGYSLVVSIEGRPTSCMITKTTGDSELDAATCASVMARARFSPASNAAGAPVESRYSNFVRWFNPSNAELHSYASQFSPKIGQKMTSYDVMPDGSVAHCRVKSWGDIVEPENMLVDLCERKRFAPLAPDADGKLVIRHFEYESKMTVTDRPAPVP